MVRLIACDLDGTLIPEGKQQLNPQIYDIIKDLKRHDILFVAASGRQFASQKNIFAPIADDISYIAENGALCIHERQTLFTIEIPREIAKSIWQHTESIPNCKTLISCPQTCYIKTGDEHFFNHVSKAMKNDTTAIEDFNCIEEPILKMAVFAPENPNQVLCELSTKSYSDMKIVYSGNSWFDFIPSYSNKGIALRRLLEHLQINPDEVIAFGDQQNDIEMLKLAGVSYVVETGSDDAKKHATHITPSVESTLTEFLKSI